MAGKSLITALVLLFLSCVCSAQVVDTTKVIELGDSAAIGLDKKKLYAKPRTATVMSAVLPGLGQVYNRKYWKVPIIYAGLGGFGYYFMVNNSKYQDYRKNLRYENDGDSLTANNSGRTSDYLSTWKKIYGQRREVCIIGMVVMYVLNIVDANVDAHLRTFDVSDDLSLSVDPWQTIDLAPATKGRIVTGLSLKLNFK